MAKEGQKFVAYSYEFSGSKENNHLIFLVADGMRSRTEQARRPNLPLGSTSVNGFVSKFNKDSYIPIGFTNIITYWLETHHTYRI